MVGVKVCCGRGSLHAYCVHHRIMSPDKSSGDMWTEQPWNLLSCLWNTKNKIMFCLSHPLSHQEQASDM